MNDDEFQREVEENVRALGSSASLRQQSLDWMIAASTEGGYAYNFAWLGRPIIQYPQDIVGLQELVWRVRPDLIIETGIARGGSLVLNASLLALLDVTDAVSKGLTLDPRQTKRRALGIDIDIRAHNRAALEAHPLRPWIQMLEGSSVAENVVTQVRQVATGYERVLVMLDSNHTHDHVLAELQAYAPMTSPGSYCVVYDTVIEDTPEELMRDRPWGRGNSPKSAVRAFLRERSDFEIDEKIEQKLQITVAPEGFLRRVR